jgi:probable H4MPT-linked C1 transfer pathway protein
LSVAASNWHALASFAATGLPTRSGFLVDIGSTTTDVIPIVDGQPAIANQTDLDRLKNRQLTYTGASRSSLAGVLSKVEIDGCSVELANEHFSTINDAYLWLGKVPERPNGRNTADGRAETRSNAAQRLARMVCADASELADESITQLAVAASNANTNRIAAAIDSVVAQFSEGDAGIPLSFVISGSGAWLVEEALDVFWKARQANERRDQAFVRLADQIGMANATAGAAHAVRVLAEKSVNARKRPG